MMGDFRFGIEDVFSISGRGTVVTGRLDYGTIRIGDEIEIHDPESRFVTRSIVVGIEQFRKTCDVAEAGGNYGILLRGISKHEVSRGSFLTGIGGHSGALEWDFSHNGAQNDDIVMNMQNHATSSKLNGGIDETKKKWWQKLF
jgi:translation elongation factor EF-Tu-like GTPase